MSLPKEPRQKMINMMYLVLTALLALNVSNEILNAFRTVDQSLNRATAIIESKNTILMNSLKDKLNTPETHDKAVIWQKFALEAQEYGNTMYAYLDNLKGSLRVAAKYDLTGQDPTKGEDNLEAATRLFVEEKRGDSLRSRLEQFKKDLLAIDTSIGREFATSLPIDLRMPQTQNSSNSDWSSAYFHMTPTIAAITILSKFQNDVKNSEAQVVEYCHNQVGAVKVIFDQYVPLVGTNSNYFMPGQELDINAGIGAYNKSSNPRISVDGASVPLNALGVAEYKTKVSSPGTYTKKVHIEFFNQATGKMDFKDQEIKYTVGSPAGANVSADSTNVLYIGIPNPITVLGGGGAGDEKVSATISQGNMVKKAPGKYDVNVETPGEVFITMNDGTKTVPFHFRAKTIPDPTGKVGNSKGGRIPVNEFKAMAGVRADLENFIFNLKYQVTGFTLIATGKAFPEKPGIAVVNGAAFDAGARAIIDKLGPNSTIMIDYIKVTGPNGNFTLPPISFYLY